MTADIDHKARSHSELSASGTERWWECPGSVLASQGLPDSTSKYAEEGTAAHELANLCLESGQDAVEFVDRQVLGYWVVEDDEAVRSAPADVKCVAAEPVQVYLDECRKYVGPGWTHWVEKRFSLEALNPPVPMFGTSDFTAYNAEQRLLVVVDYKHGQGVAKDAEGNPQLRYYALGAVYAMPEATAIDTVRTTIVQPRLFGHRPIKTAEIDTVTLVEWSIDLIKHAEITQRPDAPFKAGEHCRFCKVSPCREQGRAATESAMIEFDEFVNEPETALVEGAVPDPANLSPAEIGAVLARLPILEGFAKAVRERALDLLERGSEVPGFMATPSQGRRKWKTEDEAETRDLLSMLFDLSDDEVSVRKLKSPSQVEGVMVARLRAGGLAAGKAKDQAKDQLRDLAETRSSGMKVVPFSALLPHASTRGDEFSEFCT